MPGWLWRLRWKLGSRMLTRAVRLLPPGTPRADLSRRVSWWAQDWCRRLDGDREFVEEIKRTTTSWRT